MDDLPDNVKKEFDYCLDTLASYLKVKLDKRPDVKLSSDETSCYNDKTKSIEIHPTHFGYGTAYFEEAAHFLRSKIVPEKKKSIDHFVQEFFGRLSESVGKRLVGNTEFANLFKENSERKYVELDFFEKRAGKYVESMILADKTQKQSIEYMENTGKLIVDLCSKMVEFSEITRTYSKEKNIEKFVEKGTEITKGAFATIREYISNTASFDRFTEEIEDAIKSVKEITSGISNIRKAHSFLETDKKELAEKNIRYYVNSINNLIPSIMDRLKLHQEMMHMYVNVDLASTNMAASLATKGFFEHFYGYLAAEEYIQSNPDFMERAPDLFRLTNRQIEKRFMKPEIFKSHLSKLSEIVKEKTSLSMICDSNEKSNINP